jgi:membrane protease YdiL (CAAX protease family)
LSNGGLRPFWRFFLCLPIFIVTEIVAVQIAASFIHYNYDSLAFEAIYRPLHLALLLATFTLMSAILDRTDLNLLVYQGLGTRGAWLKYTTRGAVLGFILVALAVILIALVGHYSLTPVSGHYLNPILLCLWVLATAAMLEEVMFRGYPYQRLIESIGPFNATLFLALFFGAVHSRNPHATWLGTVNTSLVGVLFAVAYLRTRSLWLPFGIHFAWNVTMGLVFGLPVSGISMFSVVAVGTAIGPTWLTGGGYGIEAAFSGTLVILIGILVLSFWRSLRSLKSSAQDANQSSGI